VVLPDELVTGDGRLGMRPVATESDSISSSDVVDLVLRWESVLGPSAAPAAVVVG